MDDSFQAPPLPHAAASLGETSDLQRVRDILFGEVQRALSGRLDALESRLTSDVEAMRTEFAERADQLHEAIEAERIQRDRERGDHDEHMRTLAESLRSTREATDARADALERALRQTMDEQAAVLSQRLVRTEVTLRDAKADRSLLADLLGRVADDLREAPTPPNTEAASLARTAPEPGDEQSSAAMPDADDDTHPDSFGTW